MSVIWFNLLGSVLNSLTGGGHILAKAVGRVAAHAGDGHECGKEQQRDEAFDKWFHNFVWLAVV